MMRLFRNVRIAGMLVLMGCAVLVGFRSGGRRNSARNAPACLSDTTQVNEALTYLRDFLDSSATQPENGQLKVRAGLTGATYASASVSSDTLVCRQAINAFATALAKNATAKATYLSSDPSALVVRVLPNRLLVTDGSNMYDGRPLWVVFDSLFVFVISGI